MGRGRGAATHNTIGAMHALLRLAASFALVLLASGCRADPPAAPPPESRAPVQRTDAGGDDKQQDPGSVLAKGGLGKEDYAKIRGELDCVEAHFKDDVAGLARTRAAIRARYGVQQDWIDQVTELTRDSSFGDRVREAVEDRRAKVCPNGVLDPAYLEMISP